MHHLLGRIEDSLGTKEMTLCTFLDIKGTFHNTSFYAMVRGACKHVADPVICEWVGAMYLSRRI